MTQAMMTITSGLIEASCVFHGEFGLAPPEREKAKAGVGDRFVIAIGGDSA
jgi:hypothetical protein